MTTTCNKGSSEGTDGKNLHNSTGEDPGGAGGMKAETNMLR